MDENKRKGREFAMAALKEHLRTKDAKTLRALCQTIKNFMEYEGIAYQACRPEDKDALLEWIDSALQQKPILYAVLCSARISEYAYFKHSLLMNGGCVPYFEEEKYRYHRDGKFWERYGLFSIEKDARSCLYVTAAKELFQHISGAELKNLLEEMQIASYVNGAVCAMVNLYGIVPFSKAYEFYRFLPSCRQDLTYEAFIKIANRFSILREDCGILLYNRRFTTTEYIRAQIQSGVKRCYPYPAYYELISKQGDKPYFILEDLDSLLCYERIEQEHCDPYAEEFSRFLQDALGYGIEESERITSSILHTCKTDCGMNTLFTSLAEQGVIPASQKLQKTMVKLILNLKNNLRLRTNRGHTIGELRQICYDAGASCSNL